MPNCSYPYRAPVPLNRAIERRDRLGLRMTLRMRSPALRDALVRVPPDAFTRANPRVLVVDDHAFFALSLAFALRLLGVRSLWPNDSLLNARHLADEIRRDEVGVVVLGSALADDRVDKPLIEACRETDARVLIIAGSHDNELEADALLAGAEAVLDKTRPFDDLARDLSHMIVGDGDRMRRQPRDFAAQAIDEVSTSARPRRKLESLSPRERDVLRCLMDGKTVDEIAHRAEISVPTVRSHVHSILTKLGVSSQLAAVAAAHRAGWTADSRLEGS